MRFKDKVAIITAAASGIGRATADIIGREGGCIAAVDIDRERLDATTAEIVAAGGEAHAYCADGASRSGPASAESPGAADGQSFRGGAVCAGA